MVIFIATFPLDILIKLTNILNVKLKDFFEFAHKTSSPKELKETLNSLLKEANGERLRLLIKLIRAVVR